MLECTTEELVECLEHHFLDNKNVRGDRWSSSEWPQESRSAYVGTELLDLLCVWSQASWLDNQCNLTQRLTIWISADLDTKPQCRFFSQLHHSIVLKLCQLIDKESSKIVEKAQHFQSFLSFWVQILLDDRSQIVRPFRIGAVWIDHGCLCHELQPSDESKKSSLPFFLGGFLVQKFRICSNLPNFASLLRSSINCLVQTCTYQFKLTEADNFL